MRTNCVDGPVGKYGWIPIIAEERMYRNSVYEI